MGWRVATIPSLVRSVARRTHFSNRWPAAVELGFGIGMAKSTIIAALSVSIIPSLLGSIVSTLSTVVSALSTVVSALSTIIPAALSAVVPSRGRARIARAARELGHLPCGGGWGCVAPAVSLAEEEEDRHEYDDYYQENDADTDAGFGSCAEPATAGSASMANRLSALIGGKGLWDC